MIRAAALYIVIIIALMIAIISASLLSVAFYYRLQQQQKARMDRLSTNLSSCTAILLSADYKPIDTVVSTDLYGDELDSALLYQQDWGVFTFNSVMAFQQRDTLKRCFLSACSYTDQAAIYLADEDRPLSVAGSTQITGDGELPKSGLKQSYVDGKAYAGKELIKGKIGFSTRELPALQEKILENMLRHFPLVNQHLQGIKGSATTAPLTDRLPATQADIGLGELEWNPKDSVVGSFYDKQKIYHLKPSQDQLSGIKIKGHIVLISDTVLTIANDALLEDVLIYAPAIIIKEGFKGSCQLFARDSIVTGKNCVFTYPSFAGVFKAEGSEIQSKISLGEGNHFSGILLSYEKARSPLQTRINIGKGSKVDGEVFATGFISMESPVTVNGKVYAKRFIVERSGTLYENYLIDVMINRLALSKYYLSSPLFKRTNQNNQILRWLN
jgi:hypothetical protein